MNTNLLLFIFSISGLNSKIKVIVLFMSKPPKYQENVPPLINKINLKFKIPEPISSSDTWNASCFKEVQWPRAPYNHASSMATIL